VSEVVVFLRAHPPFDALAPEELERVAAATEVEFFPAGATIFAQGVRPIEDVRVVRAGAVELVLAGRVLDLLGVGELFGYSSMLSGLPPGFAARGVRRARDTPRFVASGDRENAHHRASPPCRDPLVSWTEAVTHGPARESSR
jgi:CRP-like cAMP-binding protein